MATGKAHIPYPPGKQAEVRAFYGQVLRWAEVPVPDSLQDRGLVWFDLGGGAELHVFPEEPADKISRRHFCLIVDDLERTRAQLTQAGHKPWDTTIIPGRPRFFCHDPCRNQVEFTKIEGDYLTLQRE